MEEKIQENAVVDDQGNILVPCIADGDYVSVQSIEADHLQAKEEIMRRQIDLVDMLNDDPSFAEFVMNLDGMNKFFVKAQMPGDLEEKYYGTLFFYELYFNDIENIWLICHACNHIKSNDDVYQWLESKWLYGKEFLSYIAREVDREQRRLMPEGQSILRKTETGKGLAQVAIKWFWERHGTYIANTREFLRDIQIPIKILNKRVDYAVGVAARTLALGDIQKAEFFQESLKIRIELASKVVEMPGLDVSTSEEDTVTGKRPLVIKSSEGELIPYTLEEAKSAAARVKNKIADIIEEESQKELSEEISKREGQSNKDGSFHEGESSSQKRRKM
jgi:hypothetical protein